MTDGHEGHESFAADGVRAGMERPSVAAADLYVKKSRYRRMLRTEGGEETGAAVEMGFAVRLFRADGRVGHAFAAGPGSVDRLGPSLDAANRLADRCSPGTSPLPPGRWDPPDLDLLDPAVETAGGVEAWLDRLERAVIEEGHGEVSIESIRCVAGTSSVTLATSVGFLGSYRSSLVTAVVALRAVRAGELMFDRSVIAGRHLATLDADRLGREAARRARLPLDGGSMPPGPVRVALEPRVACVLLEHLAPSLMEGAAERGRSALPPEERGAVVGPTVLNLLDNPALRRGIASSPFDGEGRPTRSHRIVEEGRLAALLGAAAGGGVDRGARVGAAHRTSFSDSPRRLPSNLHLQPGRRGPRGMLAEAGTVLRVTGASLLGRGGPASGEVVLAASGERLEAGASAGGVRGVTLVGTLRDLLSGVLEVGNNLSFHLRGATFGSPTLLLDGFTVV